MEFRIKSIFIALAGVFLAGVAVAHVCQCGYPGNTCSTNQYCVKHDIFDEIGMPDYDYDCESCPTGQVHSPNDCFNCIPQQCAAGYGHCPDEIVGDDKKCKEYIDGCPAGSDCHKYKVCNMVNGAITYEVTGPCHLEGSTCYENERFCNEFDKGVLWGGAWNNSNNSDEQMKCTTQSEKAFWQQNKWDVSACRCAHNGFIWRQKCTGEYILKPATGNQSISNVNGTILYGEVEHYHCNNCSAGMYPNVIMHQDGAKVCYNTQVMNTPYVVCGCGAVSGNYYAPGCNISYPFGSGSVPDDCRQECPTGMETIEDGATSINDCLPRGGVIYQDSTGSFRLGTNPC